MACQSGGASPGPRSIEVTLRNAAGQEVAAAVIVQGLVPSMVGGPAIATSPTAASGARQSQPPSTPPTLSPSPTSAEGVTIGVQVTDLPPGSHGFHVDSVGRCDAPDFSSSGPHLNPDNRSHGVKSANGPQAGDLPNLTVDADRTALAGFVVKHLSMSQLESAPNGTALVIDARPDDDLTAPDGNSGPHLACGVIQAAPAPSASPSSPATATASPSAAAPSASAPVPPFNDQDADNAGGTFVPSRSDGDGQG
jgi:Cu-Zn family superoxide dismutase